MDDGGWEATIEQLKSFLVFALGEPEPEYAGSPSAFDGIDAPASIRALYEFAANWPCEDNKQTWSLFGGYWPQNMLHKPENWETKDGFVMFAQENQGVCNWGFPAEDATDPSPMVSCDIEGWEDSLTEPLANFLLAWCMTEVTLRRQIHGPARVLRLVEDMTPQLVAKSNTWGTLESYANKVLVNTPTRGIQLVSIVGTEEVAETLGEDAAPYRAIDVRFSYDRVRWRVKLDEFGGGYVWANYEHIRLDGVVPASFFDELFEAELESKAADGRLAHVRTSEPSAEIVRNWAHTIRREGYVADDLTDRLFGYLHAEPKLTELIDTLSPYG